MMPNEGLVALVVQQERAWFPRNERDEQETCLGARLLS